MLSICWEGFARSSWDSVSRHSSYNLRAARRSPEKASDSILARIASSQSSSSDSIRPANCSICRVSPRRRQLSRRMQKALIILGSSLACSRSFQRANSPESGMSKPSRNPAISSGLVVSVPRMSPDRSRSRSSSSRPLTSLTWSLFDSIPPGPNLGRRIDSAVARECRASAVGTCGQKTSAKRSRLWEWRASTERYTKSARCFLVREMAPARLLARTRSAGPSNGDTAAPPSRPLKARCTKIMQHHKTTVNGSDATRPMFV